MAEKPEKHANPRQLTVTTTQWRVYTESAQSMGFTNMAAAPAQPVSHPERIMDWVANDYHAEMHWYSRTIDQRLDPSLIIDDAASIIILATPYHKEPCTLAGAKLARYACGDDYHDVLLPKLKTLCAQMEGDFPEAAFRPYVDTGPVLERYWAERSGIGWIGKNGNLINRERGSYLFLASIVTNLRVPYGEPHTDFCGNCRACLDACPTDAFPQPRVVDSRKCISYLNIEHRGPFEGAPAFEGWIFGCDICQEVCPWTGKFSGATQNEAFEPRPSYEQVDAKDLAEISQENFSVLFRKSPIKRTKIAGIKRNLTHLQATTAKQASD